MSTAAMERVRAVLQAAARLADPTTSLGARARSELPADTGLSAENVELGLQRHMERELGDEQLRAFCSGVSTCRKAHVLLAANVFTAPVRAVALALAQSARVDVRASTRQSRFAELFAEAADGAFRLVPDLSPAPDDHVWAYGRDETLRTVRDTLPAGTVFHAHASGFGVVAIVQAAAPADAAALVVQDVVPFDQRGCLSPRIVLLQGEPAFAQSFAEDLAKELSRSNYEVPASGLSDEEAAELSRYRDTMTYCGEVRAAGKSVIGLDLNGNVLLPPPGRNVHVALVQDFAPALQEIARHVTSVSSPEGLHPLLAELLPGARSSALGSQQRPPLDGPVDLREQARGEVL